MHSKLGINLNFCLDHSLLETRSSFGRSFTSEINEKWAFIACACGQYYKHLSKPERKFIGLLVLMLCAPSEITIEFYHDTPDHYKDEGF